MGYDVFYRQLEGLVDSINHESDPAERLLNLQQLSKDARRMLLNYRDRAAYDLRVKYSSEDAESITGIERHHIEYWAKRWRTRNGMPPIKRKKRHADLSSALVLSRGRDFPRSTRPRS